MATTAGNPPRHPSAEPLELPAPSLHPLAASLGWPDAHLTHLAGDGSDRRYFRIANPAQPTQRYVVMQLGAADAQRLAAGTYEWVQIAHELQRYGLHVPTIVSTLPGEGTLVIDDFGDLTFEARCSELLEAGAHDAVTDLYLEAVGVLGHFLGLPASAGLNCQQRAFDHTKFSYELRFFAQHYLRAILGVTLTGVEAAAFDRDLEALLAYLCALPRHCVHRDFHSRNLLICPPPQGLGVIDFQDARLGPAAYDLVSLCFDAYVPLSLAQRHEILILGIARLGKRLGEDMAKELAASWRPMLLQRQLKALGSFGYLTKIKQRGDYLRYVRSAVISLGLCRDERWPFLSGELIERYLQDDPLSLEAARHA